MINSEICLYHQLIEIFKGKISNIIYIMNIPDLNNSKRFANDNYKRPKKTMQDKLTPEEIEERLEDYIEVEDIQNVSLNTHIFQL